MKIITPEQMDKVLKKYGKIPDDYVIEYGEKQ